MKLPLAIVPLLIPLSLAAQDAPRLAGTPVAPPPPAWAPPGVAHARADAPPGCTVRDVTKLGRNPTPAELRCRWGGAGPGRFGLLSYADVPVYQPRTPLPGTHLAGVPGMPSPAPGESFEHWEWRVLRTSYGPGVRNVFRAPEMLDPVFAGKLLALETELRRRHVHATRRETWRSPERQAWLFQQGRSRPGAIVTNTLTSWHTRVDRLGRPAALAADFAVAPRDLVAFHEAAALVGLSGYGPSSDDPGHVYLPDEQSIPAMEVAVLRLLPRVPHVTLATGRPVDETPIPGMPRYWQELAALFVARWEPIGNPNVLLPRVAYVGLRLPPPLPKTVHAETQRTRRRH